jgi:hypothetical protein
VARELRIVEVAQLPWPWNPFRCRFADDFHERVPNHEDLSQEQLAAAFAEMVGDLGSRVEECCYHTYDWRWITEAAITLHEQGISSLERETAEWVRSQSRGNQEIEGIDALIGWDPISWSDAQPAVTSGQHRVCAIKCSGATRCLVAR